MPEVNSKLQQRQTRDGLGQDIQTFRAKQKADHLVLLFPDDVALGILRDNIFKCLSPIMEHNKALKLEAVAATSILCDRIGKINRATDRIVKVDINVYGLRQDAKRIGEELSSKRLWLQRPDKTPFQYENPHVISFPGMEHVLAGVNEVQTNSGTHNPRSEEERVQQFVSEVHDSLQRANELETTSGDRRLKTALLEYVAYSCVFIRY